MEVLVLFLCRVFLAVIVLSSMGCFAQEATLDGFQGVWLRNAKAEAFLGITPYPRVCAFRMLGGASPLATDFHAMEQFKESLGIRTWVMMPRQTSESNLPALRPASFFEVTAQSATLHGEVDPTTKLQVIMQVTLDAEQPILQVTHGIRNAGETPSQIAAWGMVALKREGCLLIPYGNEDPFIRKITYFFQMLMNQPAITYGEQAFTVDLTAPLQGGFIKMGVESKDGVGAWIGTECIVQVSSPRVAGEYPEGGANLTCFTMHSADLPGWAEIEHVSPLTTLRQDETVWLEQTVKLLPRTATRATPDAWCELLCPVEHCADDAQAR